MSPSLETRALLFATAATVSAVMLYSALKENMAHNAAITTATLAELTGPNAPRVFISASGMYYRRPGNQDACYLVIDGKAVPNTCYQK